MRVPGRPVVPRLREEQPETKGPPAAPDAERERLFEEGRRAARFRIIRTGTVHLGLRVPGVAHRPQVSRRLRVAV
ncbi:hypothetical protein SUDANB51_00379 [Streptomyces sp. enrichment culture]